MTETPARPPDTSYRHTLPSRFARSLRSLAHPSHALASPPSATSRGARHRETGALVDRVGARQPLVVGQEVSIPSRRPRSGESATVVTEHHGRVVPPVELTETAAARPPLGLSPQEVATRRDARLVVRRERGLVAGEK